MKFLEKLSLIIFSLIMLVISVINCLLIFGWLKLATIYSFATDILNNSAYSNAILAFSVVLAIKCIFFSSHEKNGSNGGNGILLENDNGKLMISRDTLINIVNGVAKGFESTENVITRVGMDKEGNLKVSVELYVHQNTIIKDLSVNLQTRIKEEVKKTVDLDVKEVDIKIRNITSENNN